MKEKKIHSYVFLVALLLVSIDQAYGQVTISNFPTSFEIHEKNTSQYYFKDITCTSVDKICICNMIKSDPTGGPFDVWLNGKSSTTYGLYYVGANNGKALDYSSVPTYKLTIECRDGTSTNKATIEVEVDIIPNIMPKITNAKYPQDSVQLDAFTVTATGSTIYTVTAYDADGDALTCSMKTSPVVSYFKIMTTSTSTCEIQTTIDMRTATEANVALTVSVTDGRATVSNFVIDVTTDLNARPDITNLPKTVSLIEDATGGTLITALTLTDDVISTRCTVNPSAEAYKFRFDSSNRIWLENLPNGALPLDFETTDKYTITCLATDGYLESLNDVLTIQVINKNEPPVFDEIAYYCDLYEGSAGVSSCSIDASVTDPEKDSILSVNFISGNNSNRFRYDKSSSTISFNVDYDIDQATGYPENVVLQLEAKDRYGATSTAPVYIKVHDINDNTCDFGASSTKVFTANQGTKLGSLGNIYAVDNDKTAPNNEVTYEVIQALPSDSTNYISAYSDGSIAYIGIIPEENSGKTYSLVVKCKDGGSPQRTAVSTVVLSYQTTTSSSTTSTTTTATTTTATASSTTSSSSSSNIFDNSAFVGVFALLMTLLILGLLVGLYFLLKYCGVFGACSGGAASQGVAGQSASGASRNLCGDNFCCSKQKQVEPVDDYINYDVRTNADYKDAYWKTGDNYESGLGFNPQDGIKPKPLTGFRHLALPPPPAITTTF
uniref:Cadherin domain-containing protein n=1 Tax=Biomphalaria glabrata TaxID=6526 RepID=A0A2C9KP40_BIOGL